MESLTPTARALLGLLHNRARTGYELKASIDKSVRFFWAASYGQIYPELKRLEEAGLVRATDDPRGGRRRTVYEITADGEAALRAWLTDESATTFELRDEALLKFFFASSLKPDETLAVIRAKRRQHEERLAALRAIEDDAKEADGFAYRTLKYGIGLQEYAIAWCRDQERELQAGAAETQR
jgi:PadR family transcriptional regulator, regulatory protein AphA